VWDFLAIRHVWSTVVLDHKWVRVVLVSIGDGRARKGDLFMRIIFLILGSIFAVEVLQNVSTKRYGIRLPWLRIKGSMCSYVIRSTRVEVSAEDSTVLMYHLLNMGNRCV